MEISLTSSRNTPTSFGRRIEIPKNKRHQVRQTCSSFSWLQFRKLFPTCSVKVSNTEQFDEPYKSTAFFNRLSASLWKSFPEPVMDFPWKKASDIALQRTLYLGKKALKWTFLGLYIITFFSDISLSISRNRELMIPLGLFVGVTMADFLKETTQELIHSSSKDWETKTQLLCIGSFFLLLKLVGKNFTIPVSLFLAHIGNGGLMQVLWLVKGLQETNDDLTEESLPS